jgi:hypothetical protein
MPDISVDAASLSALSRDLRSLAVRTDGARRTAVGATDWDRSEVATPALAADVDWFYRRAVRRIETLYDLMAGEADSVNKAGLTYVWTDDAVRRDVEPGPPGRMRRSA